MKVIARLRRTARALLDGADRVLHPVRHRAALARVREAPPRTVLFVCHGNICRSPFAAAAAARHFERLRGAVTIASAGFIGPGRTCPPTALEAARAAGIDLSWHRSTLVTPDTAVGADLIVVMDTRQREQICSVYRRRRRDVVLLGDFDPQADGGRTIRDPLDQPRQVFDACYARIGRGVTARAEAATGGVTPRP